jgi:hypothetical protein
VRKREKGVGGRREKKRKKEFALFCIFTNHFESETQTKTYR